MTKITALRFARVKYASVEVFVRGDSLPLSDIQSSLEKHYICFYILYDLVHVHINYMKTELNQVTACPVNTSCSRPKITVALVKSR